MSAAQRSVLSHPRKSGEERCAKELAASFGASDLGSQGLNCARPPASDLYVETSHRNIRSPPQTPTTEVLVSGGLGSHWVAYSQRKTPKRSPSPGRGPVDAALPGLGESLRLQSWSVGGVAATHAVLSYSCSSGTWSASQGQPHLKDALAKGGAAQSQASRQSKVSTGIDEPPTLRAGGSWGLFGVA